VSEPQTSYSNAGYSLEPNEKMWHYLVVGFTTPCAISVDHHWSCEFEPCSWRGVFDKTLCNKVCPWLATGQGQTLLHNVLNINRSSFSFKTTSVG
jgi:hypothetical protein